MSEINFQTLSSFLWSFWTILGLFSAILVPFLNQELSEDTRSSGNTTKGVLKQFTSLLDVRN